MHVKIHLEIHVEIHGEIHLKLDVIFRCSISTIKKIGPIDLIPLRRSFQDFCNLC